MPLGTYYEQLWGETQFNLFCSGSTVYNYLLIRLVIRDT